MNNDCNFSASFTELQAILKALCWTQVECNEASGLSQMLAFTPLYLDSYWEDSGFFFSIGKKTFHPHHVCSYQISLQGTKITSGFTDCQCTCSIQCSSSLVLQLVQFLVSVIAPQLCGVSSRPHPLRSLKLFTSRCPRGWIILVFNFLYLSILQAGWYTNPAIVCAYPQKFCLRGAIQS